MNSILYVGAEAEALSERSTESLERTLHPVPAVINADVQGPWTLDVAAKREIATLYHSIDALRTHAGSQVIQLIGSVENEGTSSIAVGTARFIAHSVGKRVLLLGGALGNDAQASRGQIVLQEELQKGRTVREIFSGLGDSGFVRACLVREEASMPRFVDSQSASDLIAQLKEVFPWVIIDSPPLSQSSTGLIFCRHSDGVVLTVEADRTRKSAVEEAHEQITKSGGNLLGVVLNKHRNYLPAWFRKFVGDC